MEYFCYLVHFVLTKVRQMLELHFLLKKKKSCSIRKVSSRVDQHYLNIKYMYLMNNSYLNYSIGYSSYLKVQRMDTFQKLCPDLQCIKRLQMINLYICKSDWANTSYSYGLMILEKAILKQ